MTIGPCFRIIHTDVGSDSTRDGATTIEGDACKEEQQFVGENGGLKSPHRRRRPVVGSGDCQQGSAEIRSTLEFGRQFVVATYVPLPFRYYLKKVSNSKRDLIAFEVEALQWKAHTNKPFSIEYANDMREGPVWLNYMHMVAGKTWYAIAFEDGIRTHDYGDKINSIGGARYSSGSRYCVCGAAVVVVNREEAAAVEVEIAKDELLWRGKSRRGGCRRWRWWLSAMEMVVVGGGAHGCRRWSWGEKGATTEKR
ncbi:hypothetical protein E3N88_01938 [Mikania micrantha]|uniref:Uncharacterized protein n=1 Tax=Mikania micrantha TaxID=192012 RepID=A0A5N6Q2L9_9ASTR|nr:hypothetical protein E3N88_01938 [Mikania micrantha]